MLYDSRPTSVGGNRGIDYDFSRKAPKGQYRIIGVDTFDGTDWIEGDYKTLVEAYDIAEANVKGAVMLKMYIYNDKGEYLIDTGTF